VKIYIAGHKGLVGSALTNQIEKLGSHEWVGQTREQLNLLDKRAVDEYIRREKPDAIILAAAKVGGIKANNDLPVEFLLENLEIQNNVISAAHAQRIEKVIFLGSSCIYPKYSPQPIKEEYLLSGQLEPTNEPYAIAKIAGLKLIQAFRREYGKNWISVMPTNVYGPNDNFDISTSHVLPALIRKFYEAQVNRAPSVELWGTGKPKREFIFSEDLADAILFLLEKYDDDTAINVGSGTEVSISELATTIAQIIGYSGEIVWNDKMPDGTPRKLLDSSLLNSYGWHPKISLENGLTKTYDWFVSHS
jgi:GDP-L-fucose synthase